MKKLGKALVGLIVGLALVVIVAGGYNQLVQLSTAGGVNTNVIYNNSNQPSTQLAIQNYVGDLTIKNTLGDALDTTVSSYVDGTTDKVIFYQQYADGSYHKLQLSASNTATISTTATMKTVWMEVSIPSGQNFYVAVPAMKGTHARMGDPTWTDANGDNLLAPTFPIDVTNVGSLNRDNQTPSFTLPILVYAMGTPTVNSGNYITGSNHTGVGAGTVPNLEKFTLDFGAQAKAVALFEIKLVMNDTTTTDWNKAQSVCNAPNVAPIPLLSFSENIGASTTTYKYDFGSGIQSTDLITVPKVGDTSVQMTCTIVSSLPSTNNGFTVTPTFTWLDMQGATHSAVGHVVKIVA